MRKKKLILTIFFLILILWLFIWGICLIFYGPAVRGGVPILTFFKESLSCSCVITYIPSIKGRVVDAETGKPMKEVNVRAGWVTSYVDPGGGSSRTFKVYAIKTDGNGEFTLPKVIKLKIPVIEIFQGINMLIYEHEYKRQYIERRAWRKGGKIKYYHIALEKIKDDEEFNKNLWKVKNFLFISLSSETYRPNDIKFIINGLKMFFEKYPESQFLEENYRRLTGFYEQKKKDYKAALKLNEEFVRKFPNSPILSRVKEDIQRLKKLLKESQEGEKNAEE